VTANVAYRWTPQRFDRAFPRCGGGEDIDFALRAAPQSLVAVPAAAVTHPLWPGGAAAAASRFARWAAGDGALIDLFPRFAYRAAPSALDLVLLGLALAAAAAAWRGPAAAAAPLRAAVAVAAAAAAIDVARDILMPHRRSRAPPALLLPAALLAFCFRNASEAGRAWGHVRRGRWRNLGGARFDWFCGADASVVRRERAQSLARAAALLAVAACAWSAAPA